MNTEKAKTPEHTHESEGHLHPVSIVVRRIVSIFSEIGFEVASGPEIETEYYNFDALNMPKDHPARDMQDTFWIQGGGDRVLRTHTSPVQIRYMETHKPPIRMIVPGKVFRHEATDATHETQFHQMEGLVVDKGISLSHLKWTLEHLLEGLFGQEIRTQLRPGYFPFVEPGVEIDMQCIRCGGDGCSSCKGSGWIEILGGGMVHPHVLIAGGIDPVEYSGFAFGVGIDRLIMLKYGVDDVRLLYNGDLRLVQQF